ncbi:acetyltransferase [Clostridium sp. YIM B02551]|uniref:acetyltransferase n=1 Tax=Clostridium sp. YIM B02551 TaxID=2910679 RepID=UPI001EEB4C6A|nr:acetyltransferase [Clostridium sp. YIM B02551]
MRKIVLIGAGGHCKIIIDIIKSRGLYEIVGITDKSEIDKKILDIDVIGDDSVLEEIFETGVEYAFICIGGISDLNIRNIIYNKLKKIGFKIPILIHKNAVISPYARIGEGTCVMANAVINADANIGCNCIINTSCVIEHDCNIDDNSHISPGTSLAGGVRIGYNSHIGIGATIIQSINIGNNVTVGAGSVVIEDIVDNTVAVGVPAKIIKYK